MTVPPTIPSFSPSERLGRKYPKPGEEYGPTQSVTSRKFGDGIVLRQARHIRR
jgi:hypothetical protein